MGEGLTGSYLFAWKGLRKYSSLAVLVLATGQEGERFNCVPTFRGGGESQQGPSSTHQLGWDGCDPAHRGVTTMLCFHSAQRL